MFKCICRLRIPGLKLEQKYLELVSRFSYDMNTVQIEYNEHKEEPPLGRNLPPTSGRIAWSRQLYHRISVPMSVFKKNPKLMDLPETKKAIKRYNHLAQVLVEYELVFHQIWNMQIDVARASLNSTVLIRHPETGEYLVNFDKHITETLRDIQVLSGMGIEVNSTGLILYSQKISLVNKFDRINVSFPLSSYFAFVVICCSLLYFLNTVFIFPMCIAVPSA